MAKRYAILGTVAGASAAIVAALVAMSGGERAQSLGLTQHGALTTAQDAGAADAVAAVSVTPGTPGQVLTVSDAGLPHWAASLSAAAYPVDLGALAWTSGGTTPVGGTAAVSGGVATITLPSGATLSLQTGANVTRVTRVLAAPSCAAYSVRARLASIGTSGDFYAVLAVKAGADATTRYGFQIRGSANDVTGWRWYSGGADSVAAYASVTGIRSGEGWARIDVIGRAVWLWTGVGSAGAQPTTWALRGTATMNTVDSAVPTHAEITAVASGALGSDQAATWDHITLDAP